MREMKWFWATDEDAEVWYGPHNTQAEALADAQKDLAVEGDAGAWLNQGEMWWPKFSVETMVENGLENSECPDPDGWQDVLGNKFIIALEAKIDAAFRELVLSGDHGATPIWQVGGDEFNVGSAFYVAFGKPEEAGTP